MEDSSEKNVFKTFRRPRRRGEILPKWDSLGGGGQGTHPTPLPTRGGVPDFKYSLINTFQHCIPTGKSEGVREGQGVTSGDGTLRGGEAAGNGSTLEFDGGRKAECNADRAGYRGTVTAV